MEAQDEWQLGIAPMNKNVKHGHAGRSGQTKEYRAWRAMLARCYNPLNKDYANYGGRGISVCDEWRKDFCRFLDDVGPVPSQEHTLDRKDSTNPYNKKNCRWATRLEQSRNRRISKRYKGKAMAEWAAIHNINYHTLMDRWRRGDRGDVLFRATENRFGHVVLR